MAERSLTQDPRGSGQWPRKTSDSGVSAACSEQKSYQLAPLTSFALLPSLFHSERGVLERGLSALVARHARVHLERPAVDAAGDRAGGRDAVGLKGERRTKGALSVVAEHEHGPALLGKLLGQSAESATAAGHGVTLRVDKGPAVPRTTRKSCRPTDDRGARRIRPGVTKET